MRVMVYFNLHKRCFSIKALEGADKGRVVAHARAVSLTDVTFKVSEAGRQRVIREKAKNVHAGAVGSLADYWPFVDSEPLDSAEPAPWKALLDELAEHAVAVTYDPYTAGHFVTREERKPVHRARRCLLQGRSALAQL